MNHRVLTAILIFAALVGVGFMVANFMAMRSELARMKHDRAEVVRIEEFIEKQAPHLHPATRRGFAEWTSESKWPVPHE